MRENGLVIQGMAMESKPGQMEENMKDSGKIIKPMEKVNSIIQMEIFMMETG